MEQLCGATATPHEIRRSESPEPRLTAVCTHGSRGVATEIKFSERVWTRREWGQNCLPMGSYQWGEGARSCREIASVTVTKVRFSFLDLTPHQLQHFQRCGVITGHKQRALLLLRERTRQSQGVHFCVAAISITYE